MDYPTRARVLDVTGEVWNGLHIATPAVSAPHVGKEGLAEMVPDPAEAGYEAVRLTLDDGTVLWGWECWWEAVS